MQTRLSINQVIERVNIGKTTIYKMMKAGEFPKCIKPTPKMSLWKLEEIEQLESELKRYNGIQDGV